jgi:hypothetical protein
MLGSMDFIGKFLDWGLRRAKHKQEVPSTSTGALAFFGGSVLMRGWLGEEIGEVEREALARRPFDIDSPLEAMDSLAAQLLDARDAGDEQAMRGCACAMKLLLRRWEVVEPARGLLLGAVDHWHEAERVKCARGV